MRFRGRLLLLLPLLFAAAPAPAQKLPTPPIPPAHDPADGPAPIPDREAAPPSSPQATGVTIKPTLLRVPTYQNQFDPSQGYVDGSRIQEDQTDRRPIPSPGLSLAIPLR
jgi:hypothetical protein